MEMQPTESAETMKPPGPYQPALRSTSVNLAIGFILGALIGLGLLQFGITPLGPHIVIGSAAIGMLLGLSSRGRRAMWALAAFVALLYFLIAYTPMMRPLMRGLERRDEPRRAPAVVVLGTDTHRDGTLGALAQDRFLEGYSLLHEGYAQRLIITDPIKTPHFNGWAPEVERQMKSLGLNYPIDLVGPVATTYDEAQAVAKLARERNWDSVLLVTHRWHMKRAAAAFEKAGVHVICVPCLEGRYDLGELHSPEDRLGAWRYWLRETVAYRVYQLRGRI